MNVIDFMRLNTIADLEKHMDTITGKMSQGMQDRLEAGGHIDTGNLISSIHNDTERTEEEITSTVSIDAVSEKGAWYAEFLEYGTGIYNESGDGRQTPWRYQDRHGEWHTTRGMVADPFIRPSIAENLGELENGIQQIMGNLKRYRG